VGHHGEMKWNPNYPDPQGLIDKLHEEHFHLMVSICRISGRNGGL